eukprot:207880-Pelagomonas_calceolata.AAC.1
MSDVHHVRCTSCQLQYFSSVHANSSHASSNTSHPDMLTQASSSAAPFHLSHKLTPALVPHMGIVSCFLLIRRPGVPQMSSIPAAQEMRCPTGAQVPLSGGRSLTWRDDIAASTAKRHCSPRMPCTIKTCQMAKRGHAEKLVYAYGEVVWLPAPQTRTSAQGGPAQSRLIKWQKGDMLKRG